MSFFYFIPVWPSRSAHNPGDAEQNWHNLEHLMRQSQRCRCDKKGIVQNARRRVQYDYFSRLISLIIIKGNVSVMKRRGEWKYNLSLM